MPDCLLNNGKKRNSYCKGKLLSIFAIIIVVIFPFNLILYAQEYLNLERVDLQTGYTNIMIKQISSDSNGFLWICAEKAIIRYDGYELKNLVKTKNLPFNSANQKILHKKNGELWIINLSRLFKYSSTGEIKLYSFIKNNDTLLNIHVEDMIGSGNKKLYVLIKGVNNKREKYFIYRYEKNYDEFILVKEIDENIEIRQNNIFLLATEELVILDDHSVKIMPLENGLTANLNFNFERKTGIINKSEAFNNLLKDNKGNYYFGSNDGYLQIIWKKGQGENIDSGYISKKIKISSETAFDANRITNLFFDEKEGVLWVCTQGDGVYKYNTKSDDISKVNFILPDYRNLDFDYVKELLIDKNRNIWIGTNNNGLYKATLKGSFVRVFDLLKRKEFKVENHVLSIIKRDNKTVWLGTIIGLIKYDLNNNKEEYLSKEKELIYCLGYDKNGNIICGLRGKIKIFNPVTKEFSSKKMVNENGKEQVIFSIEPLNDGGFLLGSNELIYTSNNFKKIIVLPIPDGADEKIKKISAGKNHIYFCNGSKYIYNFNPVAKKISKYEPVASGIKIGQIKSFYLRNDGNLMLLNKENQIFLQVESEKDNKILFKPFLMDSRNFNNYPINEILYENANDIWFETSKSGIWKYSFQNQNFMQFDRRYGINMDNFVLKATSTTANDEILLGGKHKFAIIKPGFFDNLNVDPKIVLTGFKMFDEEKMLNDEINNLEELDLSYTDNYFTLEFACLDFTDAANNQFKYKLEGFDKDWINSRNIRSASYTNLPGGRYRFRVIGANSEGKWDLVGKSIILNIERPPWKRWYAYLLSVLIPSTIIFIFIYYRSQKNKEKIALIKKYAGDMLTIQEKERARISRDVHDAATQQVVAAKMKLNIFRDGGDTHEEIINAEALLEESIKNLREISHDLHPAILQDLGLKRALKNLFHKFSNRTGINTQIENLDLPDELPDDLSINIYRIIQESLNNIEKHSGAKNVKFVYNTYDDKIIFSVKDDGAGFDVQSVLHDKERTSLGLRNITERVNYFEGVYEIWSDKKSGTEIKITLPLKKNK